MVNYIDIIISNGLKDVINAKVLFMDNICIINDKKYQITDTFKNNILSTICLWKNEYGCDNKKDSPEFFVKVFTDEGIDIFHGKGIFPDNYEHLIGLLGDLDD